MNKSVGEIAELVGGAVIGDPTVRITGVNGIKQAKPGDLSFIGNRQYVPFLESSEASAVLVSPEIQEWKGPIIQVANPYLAFVRVIQEYVQTPPCHPTGISPTAVLGENVELGQGVALDAYVRIADNVRIGRGSVLYAGVYIGHGCTLGENTVIYPNVVIREGTRIGDRCIIHSGAMIGTDGFGFAPMGPVWAKVPQVGDVVIGDDVEIGSNSAVDRATFGSTVVGRGTKIDNLVQIGHNVQIGEHCVISGMTGVAGSAVIGNHVTIGGQVAIADHVQIGDGATLAGRATVFGPIGAGQVVSGYPAMDHKTSLRILAATRRLPDLLHQAKVLEQRVQELEKQLYGKAADHS
ncbi:MAG: UDP-3-O-(3-hydroxymyristoyl)glucosamine N-acyltransferase [Candidatus Hydrogenedentes bacterium]|nr:UDP-3-O-(3-hydroxymyristoyl)glucosamine N-acyltransferase [Candidatus Hydrogenedentota bacterium]